MTESSSVDERLADLAFRLGWALAGHLPERLMSALVTRLADQVSRRRSAAVRQLERNLRRAVPVASQEQLRCLSQQSMRSYLRYWFEVLSLPSWSAHRTVDSVVTSGEDGLRRAFAGGQGAIIALPHMANWDHAGAWACLTGMPVSTVAERLRPPSLFDRFVEYREGLGMEVIALTGAGSPLASLRASLRSGRLVCLLADRDLTGAGLEVQLLGEPARVAAGPAALSRASGTPMVALTLSYRGALLHLDFSPLIEVRPGREGLVAMTQDVADWFSRGITAHPVDWHMLQPVFAADLVATAHTAGAGA